MKRVIVTLVAVFALFFTGQASADSGQCPGFNDPTNTKIDTNDGSVILPAGTQFCIHASNNNTGILTADGSSSLDDYIALYIVNNGGQVPAISNYVIYPEVTPSESPSPSPSPSSEPSPSASPTPSQEPSPTPTASPTTTPTPTPSMTSTPTPSSEPTKTPAVTPPATDTTGATSPSESGNTLLMLLAFALGGFIGIAVSAKFSKR